ncbi:MAG: DUF72 domain-containing protein [Saprospiraceae bacterium]|nr:DUF72 domain-containing protein [Saprospiraceae bacterium]
MDFGKLPSVDNIDFTLPPDPEHNRELLRNFSSATPPRIYIGATGYNMKAWVGTWYAPGTRERDFLQQYGLQFNTIEHNTTHYRIPDTATVGRWKSDTPEDFRFCPKIPQTISHARDLGLSSGQIPLFCEVIAGLDEKLGCCFLQLPPHFSVREVHLLERFLESFPASIPLAVEVRHPSFFQVSDAAEDYFSLLQKRNVSTVITDVAGRRDVCHLRLTHLRVLVRFVGNALHPSDRQRVEQWAKRIGEWCSEGLQEVYFFTHEPDNLLAPELAAICADAFSKQLPPAIIRGPAKVSGRQGTLF